MSLRTLQKAAIVAAIRPIIQTEIRGWGKLYNTFVGSWQHDDFWKESAPQIIRDKRCGYHRIVDIRNWADRNLYFLGRWYDLEAALALEAFVRPGQTVVDVGANFGHFALEAASRVGPAGKVFAFEPNPKVFARLEMHCDLNDLYWITTRNMGISDADGQLQLTVPRVNSGEATFGKSEYSDVDVHIADVRRLDDVLNDTKVDFLKIDVEGFEAHVLRGATNMLQRDQPFLITEIVAQHLANSGEEPGSLSRILCPLGYTSYKIGLKGSGAQQKLRLQKMPELNENADYLWVPTGQVDKVAPYLD